MSEDKKKKPKLTVKQKRFVEEVANPKTKSVRQAAINAGYAETTATVHSYAMLENVRISDAIQRRIARVTAHHKVTPEEVLGSAVFNMRSSMDDMMDDEGYFDLKKARETGAVDLIKEIEFDEKIDLETGTRSIKHKVKFESPAAARKEVANYIGLENFGKTPKDFTDTELAQELFRRLVEKRGFSIEKAIAAALMEFPDADVKQLAPETAE